MLLLANNSMLFLIGAIIAIIAISYCVANSMLFLIGAILYCVL